ncbi:MAG: thioredoxin domain-containing protein, partial [Acidobacteriota bacterium]
QRRYLDSARRAARFLLDTMIDGDRLLATYRQGRAKVPACLDDYAFLLGSLFELYLSDFDIHWLDQAVQLADRLDELFWDDDGGGFFFTGSDHETLILRPKSGHDGALPSGNAMAASYLFKLAACTGDWRYQTRARETLRAFQAQMQKSPAGFAQMLCALDDYLAKSRQVAIVGPEDSSHTRKALERIWGLFAPNELVTLLDVTWAHRSQVEERVPLLEGKSPVEGSSRPRFYICEDYACQAPTENLGDVEDALRSPA